MTGDVYGHVAKAAAPPNRVAAGVLLSFTAFSLFASGDAAAKYLSSDYAVLQILFMGSIFAFIPILAFLLTTDGIASVRPKHLGLCLLRGALTALSVLAIVWSFTRLPLAEGYALAFTAPLIVAALSGWLLRERVNWRQWIAVFIGFAGVLIMLRPGFSAINGGHAAALTSAMIFALALIVLRRLGNSETAGALLITYLVATLMIYGPFVGPLWIQPDHYSAWLLMAGIGIFSGAGQIALVLAFRMAPAAMVSPIQYTQLIWGVVFGFFLFGDIPDGIMIFGGAMVSSSGWLLLRKKPSVTSH